ncbi:MAG: hypothetical protein R3C11_15380 [Planctomycetaceae bacterium]
MTWFVLTTGWSLIINLNLSRDARSARFITIFRREGDKTTLERAEIPIGIAWYARWRYCRRSCSFSAAVRPEHLY